MFRGGWGRGGGLLAACCMVGSPSPWRIWTVHAAPSLQNIVSSSNSHSFTLLQHSASVLSAAKASLSALGLQKPHCFHSNSPPQYSVANLEEPIHTHTHIHTFPCQMGVFGLWREPGADMERSRWPLFYIPFGSLVGHFTATWFEYFSLLCLCLN